jgi:alanyl-tRNA synthetase
MQINPDEFDIPFFREHGFVRKLCPHCREYYWTQDETSTHCGDAPCTDYDFIGNPPTNKKYSNSEMREKFLNYFERNGHKRISPYPVVARWRDDLMFTIASIIDFQPYVTEGILPPPANPLVISQPCLRFEDIDLVGITAGRHLTIFEMGGHHAFNYEGGEQVYWKNKTVEYHHGLVKEIGVQSESVKYKEGIWAGGGNAGFCLEPTVGGLEISTLVFMQYRVVNGEWSQMPINIVDTGYGIERWTWLSHGSSSAFHAIYGPILDTTLNWADIKLDEELFSELAKYSYLINLERQEMERKNIANKVGIDYQQLIDTLYPVEGIYGAIDHTKAMAFILSEGIVPSNVKEGYLTRMLFRRGYRFLRRAGIEERLPELVSLQIDFWGDDFPQLLKMKDEILEMVDVEEKKYRDTLSRGKSMVQRRIQKNEKITRDQLVEFYESHGLTPEDVQEAAQEIGKNLNIPSDFYTRISSKHMGEDNKKEIVEKEGADIAKKLEDLPSTRHLFYENIYDKEMEAEVIEVLDGTKIILDQTVFYAEGGGQISDQGVLLTGETEYSVIDVQSIEGVILHIVDRPGIMKGDYVHGVIDWERRMALMRAHTSTHIIIGAARRVLGEHAWQAGASKTVQSARLDISHYARITREQVEEIERLANMVVREGREVTCKFMQRDIAEKKYGFRLYQGGAVPGKEIRIVDMGDWDIEACGGTHLSNTSQIGLIKIIGTERVQDGVERLVYAAGSYALEEIQRREALLMDAAELLGAPYDSILESIQNNIDTIKSLRSQLDDLRKSLGSELAGNLIEKALDVDGVKVVFYSDEIDFDFLIELGNSMEEIEPNIVAFLISTNQKRFGVKAGKRAMDKGIHAGRLTTELGKLLGGGGGGAPYFGQGGGGDVDKFYDYKSEMLKAVKVQLE